MLLETSQDQVDGSDDATAVERVDEASQMISKITRSVPDDLQNTLVTFLQCGRTQRACYCRFLC